jgi:hypothetical protein
MEAGKGLGARLVVDDGGQFLPVTVGEVGVEEFSTGDQAPDQPCGSLGVCRRLPRDLDVGRIVVQQGNRTARRRHGVLLALS